MKQDEVELNDSGLEPSQLALLREQYQHLRAEGRGVDMGVLALRSRFVGADRLEPTEEKDDQSQGVSGQGVQNILPLEYCRRFNCVPFDYSKGVLSLRCSQPLLRAQLAKIRQVLKVFVQEVKIVPASRQEIQAMLIKLEQSDSVTGLINVLRTEGLEAGHLRGLVYATLKEALRLKASDIHLSRKPDPDAWIAYRVDSVMRQNHLLPELLMQSLVARIKIEAGMDASNSRTAQDGRLTVEYEGRTVDFRISTQPLVDGESVVLRALDSSVLPSLSALFPLQPRMNYLIKSITSQSGKTGGLVFVTGATGSGKSTTQYTMACGFRRDAMNVITVEDPVEYILPFSKQIQLQSLMRQKAVELERSILRQDPDILIFGEIRDADSARAALAFAESGHLVISTIHANSVLQVSERFLSIIDNSHREDAEFLLAHYLRLAIHQRLERKLCVCAEPLTQTELEEIEVVETRVTGGLIKVREGLKKAVGCAKCEGTGYRGRVAVHETMHIAKQEDIRAKFVRAFKGHQIELPADLHMGNGVEFISRFETYQTLLNNGVIDWPTVVKSVGVVEE